jgi:hypothetical protein
LLGLWLVVPFAVVVGGVAGGGSGGVVRGGGVVVSGWCGACLPAKLLCWVACLLAGWWVGGCAWWGGWWVWVGVRSWFENCIVDASIFVAKLLRAHGGCLGTRSR